MSKKVYRSLDPNKVGKCLNSYRIYHKLTHQQMAMILSTYQAAYTQVESGTKRINKAQFHLACAFFPTFEGAIE